jgi:hypothetical protein
MTPLRKASLATAGVLLLAGCSSGGHAATPSTAPNANQVASLYRQLAQCIRTHGLPNFPDPVQNGQTGDWQLPVGVAKPPAAVMNACKSISDRLPASRNDTPLSAAEMVKARELSRCMRQHGIADWPDPDASGAFPLPPRLIQLGKRGIMSQIKACGQYWPRRSINIVPQAHG